MFDVWKALWFTDPATGAVSFGIGVGTLVLAANAVLLTLYLFGCHTLRHLSAAASTNLGGRSPTDYASRELPEPPAHVVGVVQPVLGGLLRSVRPPVLGGRNGRTQIF